jgi:hypothetical protein
MGIRRSWFGPSKEDIWKQLATEIRANYVQGGWSGGKVQAQHGEWTITLEAFTDVQIVNDVPISSEYTRMRAPYVNRDGFRFNIYRKQLFSDFGKWMGMQDVEVGHREFDEAFIIQGNDDKKLRALFGNATIRELIQAQSTIGLSVRPDQGWFSRIFPEGVDELYFLVSGVIKDVDRLKSLFDLFGVTLDHLCQIGSAYERDPGVTL